MPKIGKSFLRVAWLSITGAGVFFGAYPFREQPIPKSLVGYDHNKNNRLERDECFNVVAALMDGNYNQRIDTKEEDSIGGKLVNDLYKAWGRNNFRSAWELRNALRAIKKMDENNDIEQEWINSINHYQD